MVNYHELIEGKVYIGGENALLDALHEQEISGNRRICVRC